VLMKPNNKLKVRAHCKRWVRISKFGRHVQTLHPARPDLACKPRSGENPVTSAGMRMDRDLPGPATPGVPSTTVSPLPIPDRMLVAFQHCRDQLRGLLDRLDVADLKQLYDAHRAATALTQVVRDLILRGAVQQPKRDSAARGSKSGRGRKRSKKRRGGFIVGTGQTRKPGSHRS